MQRIVEVISAEGSSETVSLLYMCVNCIIICIKAQKAAEKYEVQLTKIKNIYYMWGVCNKKTQFSVNI